MFSNDISLLLRQSNPCTYDSDILDKLDKIANSKTSNGEDIIIDINDWDGRDGGLFEQAVELTLAYGQISTSTLQRRLKIGYARAGKVMTEMETRGIIASKDGYKPCKCLITREKWEEMKNSLE